MSKDKNYNMHVAKVNEKENKMEIVKKDIKGLEEHYQKLRNDCSNIKKLFSLRYSVYLIRRI
jgi:hypothetical protein